MSLTSRQSEDIASDLALAVDQSPSELAEAYVVFVSAGIYRITFRERHDNHEHTCFYADGEAEELSAILPAIGGTGSERGAE